MARNNIIIGEALSSFIYTWNSISFQSTAKSTLEILQVWKIPEEIFILPKARCQDSSFLSAHAESSILNPRAVSEAQESKSASPCWELRGAGQ